MQNVSEERISEERISKLSKISKNLSISHDDMDLVADIHSVSSSEVSCFKISCIFEIYKLH